MTVKTGTPKTIKELADLADQQAGDSDSMEVDDYTFEGGPLDGQSMTAKEVKENLPAPKDADDPEAKATLDPAAQKADAEKLPELEVKEDGTAEATAEAAADGKASEVDGTKEEYKPDFSYKVYDEQKEFPDWAKALVTSKEAEDNVRRTLQKSEAFDALKPKHETVVRERDETKRQVVDHANRVSALIEARDKNLELFFHKTGVNDDAILRYAAQIAEKRQDPSEWHQHLTEKQQRMSLVDQQDSLAAQQAQIASHREQQHHEAFAATLNAPGVSEFRARMDKVMGDGTFEKTLRGYGSLKYNSEGAYIPPIEAAKWVMENYGSVLPLANATAAASAPGATQQQQGVQPTAAQGAPAVPGRVKERPKTLPSVGRGTATSPTGQRPRNLKELKEHVDRELGNS